MFALIGLLPMLAYVLIQTARDLRGRKWAMVLWGGLMSILLMCLVAKTFISPGY